MQVPVHLSNVMIFKTIKQFILKFLAGANLVTILLMMAAGFSGRLSPIDHPMLTQANFVFPLFILINGGFLLLWVLIKPRWVFIPVIGFLVNFVPVHSYCPVNLPKKAPEGSIKVMSYNVEGFVHSRMTDDEGRSIIPNYILAEDADIVCLQEGYSNIPTNKILDKLLNPVYAYRDSSNAGKNGNPLLIYSKYPIVRKEHLDNVVGGNHSAAFFLDIGGDTVIVINNHLKSLQLTQEDRTGFQSMVEGNVSDGDSVRRESHKLFDKLRAASILRAPQAECVARYISDHAGQSIIVCGDFNDGPLSYTNHIIGENLTDCYVAAGNGPGFSFHENGMLVRIDNILCSKDWTPFEAKVDRKMDLSDHYPVQCKLKKGLKP